MAVAQKGLAPALSGNAKRCEGTAESGMGIDAIGRGNAAICAGMA